MKTLKQQINHYVFPLIASQLLQMAIGIAALHFATAGSTHSLSAITIIQNFLYAFGGILGAFSLSFNILGGAKFLPREAMVPAICTFSLALVFIIWRGLLSSLLAFWQTVFAIFLWFSRGFIAKSESVSLYHVRLYLTIIAFVSF